ncbi:MAG: acyl carrier protein [Luteitalea sp.]|nr:acyl carrier protein [Luteitalea sp.]
MPMQLEQELRHFVVDNFLFGQDDGSLSDDDSFIDKGIVDSTGVLELIGFLETRYGIKVEDDELVPANLDTLNRLSAFVQRKLDDAGGQLAS